MSHDFDLARQIRIAAAQRREANRLRAEHERRERNATIFGLSLAISFALLLLAAFV